MADGTPMLAGCLFALFCVVGVVYLIRQSYMCDDGSPHEWQVWVPKGREAGSVVMERTCLKCGWIERRYV